MQFILSGFLLLAAAASVSASSQPSNSSISALSWQELQKYSHRAFDQPKESNVCAFYSPIFQLGKDDPTYNPEATIPNSLEDLRLQAEGSERLYYDCVLGHIPVVHEGETTLRILEDIVNASTSFLPKTEIHIVHMAAEHTRRTLNTVEDALAIKLLSNICEYFLCRQNIRSHIYPKSSGTTLQS
jgi:hypothetical protein